MQLRAERDVTLNGRVYLVTVSATDAAGNVAVRSLPVTVPSQFTTTSINGVRNQGLADAAACIVGGGAPPAGHVNLVPFTNFP